QAEVGAAKTMIERPGSRSRDHSASSIRSQIERCLLASATIRLPSTANPSPPTSPAAIQASTTRSNTRRKMSLSRKTLIAGAGECRVLRDLVLDAQAAEPPVRQVDLNLTTEQPLRAGCQKHGRQ